MRIPSDDVEIFYEVIGDGPAVVLLHAFPTDHRLWLPAADLLSARYRLLLPDLRGHGESGRGAGKATMARHADDLVRVCDAAGVGRAVFAGVSIGGYILFEFWRRYRDRVAALVLCDTRANPDTPEARAARLQSAQDVLQHGPAQFCESMIPKLLGQSTRSNRPDVVDAVRKLMSKATAQGIASVQEGMAERPDSMATLKTITVPTLLVFGEEDGLSPLEVAEAMRRELPQGRLEVLPRAGHLAVFERPQAAGAAIRNFLDALPPW